MTAGGRRPDGGAAPVDGTREVLRHVGGGERGGCGFGTPDGPCPNAAVTSVAAAAAHPDDGVARWLVPAWTPVCGWHRDAVDAALAGGPDVGGLWRARRGRADEHAEVVGPARRGLARWLGTTPGGLWSGELGL